MGWNTFFEDNDTEAFIKSISCFVFPYSRQSQPIVFGVYLESRELPIGYVALKGLNRDLLTAEIAVAILDKQFHDKGYGKLALELMITYAFRKLHIKIIAAAILISNQMSINIAKRLGFVVKEIMYNSWTLPNGQLTDMLWMEITSQTWK